MEFDKSKVYTVITADEIKLGSKGYYADCLKDLEERVNSDDKTHYDTLIGITPASEVYRFKIGAAFSSEYALFYLVEEPVEEERSRPYRDTNEMIECYNRHFNLLPAKHIPPIMWIKNNGRAYLITRITEDSVTVCFERSVFTLSLEILASNYTWLDDAFCGVEGR